MIAGYDYGNESVVRRGGRRSGSSISSRRPYTFALFITGDGCKL